MMFRETGDSTYLHAAIKMADWYLNHPNLPKDRVPLWDFNVGEEGYNPDVNLFAFHNKGTYRDVSAAAITGSALFELYEYSSNKIYLENAILTLKSLSSPVYRAEIGENAGFLLKHSVGSLPHKVEIDKPLVYADYYFLEALTRYKKYKSQK